MGLLRFTDIAPPPEGGVAYVYRVGGDTLLALFSDDNLTVSLANPLKSSAGEAFQDCYIIESDARIVVYDKRGNLVQDYPSFSSSEAQVVFGRIFDVSDVSEALSNASLTYSNLRDGDLLRTVRGGHTYQVQPQGATEYHVMTAAGVKLTVLAGPDGRYAIDAFGATGDGVADDTAAFEAFQRLALAAPNTISAELALSPNKHYTYTNNKWVQGFRALEIWGGGAKLECIASTQIFSIDKNIFNFQDWNSELGLSDRTGADVQFQGDLIETTAAAQPDVVLQVSANAANYAVGDPVLVYGLTNQDGGAPMDARYFEYRTIAGIDTGTGTVTMTQDLSFDYDRDWPALYTYQSGDAAGPPRLLALQRSNRFFTERLTVHAVRFILNRNAPTTSRLAIVGAGQAHFHDCDMTDLVEVTVGSLEYCLFFNCRLGHVEFDKLTNRIDVKQCHADILNQGVGVSVLNIEGGAIGKELEVGSRNVLVKGTRLENVRSGTAKIRPNYTNPRRVETYIIDSIDCPDRTTPLHQSSFFTSHTFTTIDGSNRLVVPKSDWQLVDHLYVGMRLASADVTAIATIDRVIEYSATEIAFEVTWETAVPSTPVTLFSALNDTFEARGGTQSYLQKSGDTVRFHVTSAAPEWSFALPQQFGDVMVPVDVSCTIHKPNSTVGPQLRLRNTRTNTNALTIDVATPGLRQFNAQGSIGATLGTDAHTPGAWTFGSWMFGPRTGGLNEIVGSSEDLPIFEFRAVFKTLL